MATSASARRLSCSSTNCSRVSSVTGQTGGPRSPIERDITFASQCGAHLSRCDSGGFTPGGSAISGPPAEEKEVEVEEDEDVGVEGEAEEDAASPGVDVLERAAGALLLPPVEERALDRTFRCERGERREGRGGRG